MLGKLNHFLKNIVSGKKSPQPPVDEQIELCCKGVVHIFYRGLSDDKLYMARDRPWNEVRFYKPNGLRVFCAGCRRHVL